MATSNRENRSERNQGRSNDLNDKTREELEAMARKQSITGISNMNKEELVNKLHGGRQPKR